MDLRTLQNKRAGVQKDLTALGAIEMGDDARELTEDELKAHAEHLDDLKAIDAKIVRATAVRDAEMNAPARTSADVVMGDDNTEARPWGPVLHAGATDAMKVEAELAGLGEWAIAARAASNGLAQDPRLFAVATGAGLAIPSEGGWAVPPEVAPGIERDMLESGAITSRVDVRTITGDNISYVHVDQTSMVDGKRQGGIRAYWTDEGAAVTPSQTTLSRLEFKLRKVGVLSYITDELAQDAAAFGGEVRAMMVDEIGFGVEDAIFEGDGAGKPHGFTNAACLITVTKETGQAATTIVGENITKMWAQMDARGQANAVWLAHVDTIPQLAVMTLDIGTAGVRYPFASVNNGQISLWGRPVIYVPYASTLGTLDDIVLVDLSQYRLVRKASGIESASSIHVRFTQGEDTLRSFYRVDGMAVPRTSLTPFKGSNNTSPFITLATRS